MQPGTTKADSRSPKSAASEPIGLPDGVTVRALPVHADQRGSIVEIFRSDWPTAIVPAQWTVTVSRAGVMRGVHAHPRHEDYFVLLDGRLMFGLHDLRAGSPTAHRAAMLELCGEAPAAIVIPHGVAHGFLFLTPSTYAVATTHHYDVADELGCQWLDPDLGLTWPTTSAQLSARDAALPSLRELVEQVPGWSVR